MSPRLKHLKSADVVDLLTAVDVRPDPRTPAGIAVDVTTQPVVSARPPEDQPGARVPHRGQHQTLDYRDIKYTHPQVRKEYTQNRRQFWLVAAAVAASLRSQVNKSKIRSELRQ